MAMMFAAPLLAALLAGGGTARATPHELQGAGLGSTWTVKIAAPPAVDASTLERGIQQQIDSVMHELSRWDSSSNLSVLNTAADSDWHAASPRLFTALSYALQLASDTGGAYDPTIAPLVDVWGFGTQGRRYSPPAPEAIAAARMRVGWAKVQLDAATSRVRRPPEVQLDLSSMTHGLAADQVAAYLRSLGVTRYLVDVGSELRAAGDAPEGHPWQVAIERPPPEFNDTASAPRRRVSTGLMAFTSDSAVTAVAANTASTAQSRAAAAPKAAASRAGSGDSPSLHVIALRDAGIATSGNYRYYFDYNGHRYSHRIDPRTGAPITHSLATVTVIASECMHADALATALTVLGPDEALDFARRHDIAALFVLRTPQGLEERMTPKFRTYLAN